MKKHAYLIIAHNNFDVLEKLLLMLDYPYHDIYIHIDKKVKNFDFDYFKNVCQKSDVFFTHKRFNVKWGHQTQVLTEMQLFEQAYQNRDYSYFHLISGVDLPLERPENIYAFFKDKDKSFLSVSPNVTQLNRERVQYYRFGFKNYRLERLSCLIQKKLKVNRTGDLLLKKGANWASLTDKSVAVLVEMKKFIEKMTFASSCADEIYKQTVLYNFAKETIYFDGNEKEETNNLRYVDWSEGKQSPKTLDIGDYENIIHSGMFFARKFDSKVSQDLIDKIYNYVMNG